jgi:probable F420-dependent oxidoreductase
MSPAVDLGRVGIRTFAFDRIPLAAVLHAAVDVERLGYGALWVGEAAGREAITQASLLLDATKPLVVAPGIARIGERSPQVMRAAQRALWEAHPGRFLLGLGGATHRGPGHDPIATMGDYLDQMAEAPYLLGGDDDAPVVLAALIGPRMLRLAARRSLGAHTYLAPVAHTRNAREVMGSGPLLAVELAVLIESDPRRARERGREHVGFYLQFPQFQAHLRRSGLTGEDLQGGGSDRLVDAAVAWGDPEGVAATVEEHLAVGADHVCIQPVADLPALDLATLETLAPLLADEFQDRRPGSRRAGVVGVTAPTPHI